MRTRSLLTLLSATCLLNAGAARDATAIERDFVVQWVAPAGSVEGYRLFHGPQGMDYDAPLDLGFVPPDSDGVSRWTLPLNAAIEYRIAMTAYNAGGESALSNEIVVAASACDPALCDDGDPCTADDCADLACVHALQPDGTFCGQGDEICLAGACGVAECFEDLDCANGELCDGAETCSGFFCSSGPILADGTACDDGDAGTGNDQCSAGACVGQLIPLACAGDVTQPRIRAKARIFQRRDGPRYVRTRFGCFDDCDQAPAVEATVEGQPVESGDLVPISGDGRVDVQCTDLAGNRSDLSFLPWQP